MEVEKRRGKRRLLIGLLVMALAAGGLWFVKSRRVPEAEIEFASVTTSEGFRLVVHRAEVGKRMTIRGPEADWSLSKVASLGSGSTWAFGTSDLEHKTKNGRFELASFVRESPSLMLLVRVWDKGGEVRSTDEADMDLRSSDGGRVERDEIGLFSGFDMYHHPSPPWSIEVGDGAGGWISTVGPLVPVDSDGRGFHMCPCFPRTIPELELLVRFDGDQADYKVKIPNPGYAKSFPSWAADPNPWRKDLGEVAVVVEQIGVVHFGEPQAEIEPASVPLIDQAPDAWEINQLGLSDRFGNQVDRYWEFARMPGVELVRYNFEIERGDAFRWPESETEVIGELVWPAGTAVGQEVVATITAEGKALGIDSLALALTADKPFHFPELRKWHISWSAETATEAAAPDPDERFTLILGEDGRSSGAMGFAFEGSWSTSSKFEIGGVFPWAGEIEPGQRVRIALPKYRPPQPFSFTFSTKDLDRALAEEE